VTVSPAIATSLLAPFLTALALSLVLVPVCRLLARRLGFVATPREDRWHRKPVALLGGVGIAAALFATVALYTDLRELEALLACGGVIFALGLIDDIWSLKPATKLVVQIALASVLLFFRFRLNWTDSLTLDMLLTLVWVVGLTNAFNLLDNMDGLCAGIALVVAAALLVNLLPATDDPYAMAAVVFLAALAGATAGFLVFNFHPASIFMGDSGSLLLGFTLAALTLSPAQNQRGIAEPLTIIAGPLFVLIIPILDTTLVTISRLLSGRSPAEGGRDHSSHRLVAIGLSERSAVLLLWALAAAAALVAVALDSVTTSWSGLLAAAFLVGMVLFAVYLGGIRVYDDADARAVSSGRFTPLVTELLYKRRVAEVGLDFSLVTLAYYAAYRLRFEGADFTVNFSSFYSSLPIVLGVQMLALFGAGVYRGVWRYFSLMDAVVVVKGVALGSLGAQLAILYLFRFESYSRTVFVIYAILLAVVLTASRASFRLIGEFLNRRRHAENRVVIYGAGGGGAIVVQELLKTQRAYKILGFVDDDPQKHRTRVQGYGVLGTFEALQPLIESGLVNTVVVSARFVDARRLRTLEDLCAAHGVLLSRLHVGLAGIIPIAADDADEPATIRRAAK